MAGTDGYTLLHTINLPGTGGHGDWVTYDPATATIWLAQSPDNNVVVIDAHTNAIKSIIPNIGNANGIALTPQYAFVADVTNNTVDVIDKNTFALIAKVAITGTTPDSVVFDPKTNQIIVASDDNNVEDFINAAAPFTQTNSVTLQPNPSAIGPDVALYVPEKDLLYQPVENKVDVIDPNTGKIVTTWTLLPTGDNVKPMVYDPITNTFLVGTSGTSTTHELLVVSDTGVVLKHIPITGSVDEASIDPNARLAFVGDKSGHVDIVNLDTDQLVGTLANSALAAEHNLHTLAVDTTNHDVYVYDGDNNKVDVYGPKPENAQYFGAFTHDPYSAGGEIYNLYQGLLGRTPDLLGFENWTAALQSGAISLQTAIHDFLSSPEFTAKFGSYTQISNHAFVEDLYQTALNRPGDPQGEAGWENALANGMSRDTVAYDFLFSTERENDLASTYSHGVFVPNATDDTIARLYYATLNRAPDAAGLESWENAAANGLSLQTIAQDFVSSSEHQAIYGSQTNQQFVDALYQGALGRPADAAGEQGWVNALNSGNLSRGTVALDFAQSPEAQEHLLPQVEVGWQLTGTTSLPA